QDPDCVFKKVGNQFYIWSPISWLHTYTLTKVPLRGRQIAYNDSGEADLEIPDICENGHLIWKKNNSPFAGLTKDQSFVCKLSDGQVGMYITTNKTNNKGKGYSIPWIPDDLCYWLIKLRKWQQKYNPIEKPTPWSSCIRTNLNEIQLRAKGVNCFLFRAFGNVEPSSVSGSLTPRLAATLYYVQPANLQLAELSENPNTLSHYKSKYTPHSMRVSLITAYVMEMGMPVEIVMKVVGHSSIVMSIYYCKVTQRDIRKKLEEGEKIALKEKANSIQHSIEQNRIDEIKNQLIGTNEEILSSLTNSTPAGNFIFRDYGICPFAATRCSDGGDLIAGSQIRAPAPSGYLGIQNCLQCRHFITGPAFLGGLVSITNEISLQANMQSKQCIALQQKITSVDDKLEEISRQEYLAQRKGEKFDDSLKHSLEIRIRKLESEYECAAKKLDMYLCDMQSAHRLIKLSQTLTNNIPLSIGDSRDALSLIKNSDSDIEIMLEETTHFEQLQEICENAKIYESANATNAIAPRSQMLDKMALYNGARPQLFMLTEEQQLIIGNQLVQLLLARLRSWDKVAQVVNCDIKLVELAEEEQISTSEIELICTSEQIDYEKRIDDT
ncbi:VPA1269 family protein, partial [Aliiglaciecola sp.]|nr:VPA1269 family protein [Aliiglaciecola sp.]